MTDRNEKKHEAFLNVAQKRTQKILDTLKLLGNCSSKNNYSYSEDEVQQMFTAIDKELKATKQRFSFDDSGDEKFSFK